MNKDTDNFLQAEDTAVKLVETLKELHNEATSYQSATQELETVRQHLIGLIESTENIANVSYEIINTLKQIGTMEILNRLEKLRLNLNQATDSINENSQEIITLIKDNIEPEILNRIEELENKTMEKLAEQDNVIIHLKKMLHNVIVIFLLLGVIIVILILAK
ncbi:MAG: hypothetical protein KAZ44_00695 [Candidatus Syntrophosphaera sp.]|jgi:uncharacterized phage infection (PIP) family protein YhgE|nr:hypothetical protein [Candidatus Syntrophosphaera sp.]